MFMNRSHYGERGAYLHGPLTHNFLFHRLPTAGLIFSCFVGVCV